MLVAPVFHALDRQNDWHKPIDIFHTGIGRGQDAPGAFAKRMAPGSRRDTDIGARITAWVFSGAWVPFPKTMPRNSAFMPSVGTVSPGIDLANRDFNCVLCPGRCGEASRNSYGKNREEARRDFNILPFIVWVV